MSTKKSFPIPLDIKKIIGPSFIILALGLGSGEVILWPYLVSNYGLGIAWGAMLGITFQFFINMEIERYALVKGESVFVGIAKMFRWAPYWFILSTFVGFGLPGIVAASAQVASHILGFETHKWVAIFMLLVIGFILSTGKTVYGMMEKITKIILLFGVPFIFILAIIMSSGMDWVALGKGVVGIGETYWGFPVGITLATFFGAFAYSGAGGNLNLTQSIYIKEKGYGMGKYSQKIAGLFSSEGKKQKIKLTGESFEMNAENISRYKKWWKLINIEHVFVFWFLGLLSMLLLMILSYSTTYGVAGNVEGISFVLREGLVIGQKLNPIVGSLFLVAVSIMLFQTQLGVMDSTSRIMSENVAIKKISKKPDGAVSLNKIYYIFLWAQIGFGILLFLFNISEPKALIVLGAVINAFAMFVHTALVALLNRRSLPKVFEPGLLRKIMLCVIFLFFGFFSFLVLFDKLNFFK